MSSKQKAITLMLSIVFISSGAIGYYTFSMSQQSDHSEPTSLAQTTTTDGYAGSLTPANPGSIRLGESQRESLSESNSLRVGNGSPNDASLGTQQQLQAINPTTTKSSSFSPTVPGPETFTEYAPYADKTEVYYVDLVVGEGPSPTPNKRLAVIYTGWLTDGRIFDQSQTNEKGEISPFIFTLGAQEVISGWDIGFENMKVGGTRRLIIPPSLAYGDAGYDGVIPANAVLIFDVQLLEVE